MKSSDDLRREKLALRDSLDAAQRRSKSAAITEKVLGLEELEQAKNIFVYVDFRSEVQTGDLIARLMERGKEISVPITHVEKKKMDAIHIRDMEKDLAPGYCGILEPRRELLEGGIVDPNTIDAIILPGSVFDERGGRMGYGGGYYDRFVEKIPYATRIGLAFEIQKVTEVPLQPHDELLDYLITEKGIIRVERI